MLDLYHGRKLLKFNDKDIKLSKNIVRNAIFNILNKDICNTKVLDLFAGSGAIGIEAISRGANPVYFVDKILMLLKLLKKI